MRTTLDRYGCVSVCSQVCVCVYERESFTCVRTCLYEFQRFVHLCGQEICAIPKYACEQRYLCTHMHARTHTLAILYLVCHSASLSLTIIYNYMLNPTQCPELKLNLILTLTLLLLLFLTTILTTNMPKLQPISQKTTTYNLSLICFISVDTKKS